uniref:SRCR domain-containing protein n=1 Tax=Gouania willdenowi TaxID=441366 RepID=A0A8C5I6S1_GOUWI
MDTSVDHRDRVSYTHTNPLFDTMNSNTDLCSFQPDDLKPARRKRPICIYIITVYLVFLTALSFYLLYKVLSLETSLTDPQSAKSVSKLQSQDGVKFEKFIHNNSEETKSLKSHVWALQKQVTSMCGDESELGRLRVDVNQLNSSSSNLLSQLNSISLKTGLRLHFFNLASTFSHPDPRECNVNFIALSVLICKMLGYQLASTTFTAAPGSGSIWLDELRCSGAERDIFDCPSNAVGVHNCNHDEDAGVQCA